MSKEKSPHEDIYAFIALYGSATIAQEASTKEKLAFIEKQFANALHSYHTNVTLDAYDMTVAVQKAMGASKR
jgi:hypothetical protein